MQAEVKVTIVNKSASVATVTYTNWSSSTSRSIMIPAGSKLITYNWYEDDSEVGGTEDWIATTENIFNLPVYDAHNDADVYTGVLTKTLIQDFGYDKNKVSVTLASGEYTEA